MHVLFIHQNFPAQFGHIAAYLVQRKGFRCSFISEQPPGNDGGIERIQYKIAGGATEQTHYCSRSYENAIWHSHAIHEALAARPDIKPDLIVAHSGFLSTVFLRELYDCPIVNYFEYFYHTQGTDLDFRPDFPYPALNRLRARARNAVLLMDLEDCDAGYSPTRWQRSLFPRVFQDKVRTIFDGIDTNVWRPQPGLPRRIGDRTVPDDVRIVTYVSRGMESIRGFDIFMQTAKRIYQRRGVSGGLRGVSGGGLRDVSGGGLRDVSGGGLRDVSAGGLRSDVLFVVVGEDRVCYGGDLDFTGGQTFKQWVLARDDYDLSRFVFTGLLPTPALAQLFSITDLHIYLTVPFVLSWSLMDALACGATVLASNTAPVREMVEHGRNGLLADFFDVDSLTDAACRVLDAPGDFKHLGRAGVELIRKRYSLDVCLPRMLHLYEDACAASRG